MTFRGYRELGDRDHSGLGEQVAAQRARVAKRLGSIRHCVAVMSGKGGVGKSWVTAAVAKAGVAHGWSVGVVDADLRSPTVCRLLGAHGPLRVEGDAVVPAVGESGIKVVSTELLLEEGQPLTWREPNSEGFVWRGTLEAGTLREFLGDVRWGACDLLCIDLPPGADGVTDLRTLVPNIRIVAVTLPSEESYQSVSRALRSATEGGLSIVGIVENMSGYQCSNCADVGRLFDGDAGMRLAADFGVPLLGRVPFVQDNSDPSVATALAPVLEAIG